MGLDSDIRKIPERFRREKHPQFAFNCAIINATHKHVSSYKMNSAFYEARGTDGLHELKMTLDYIREHHSGIFTILDAKRADIGSTNEGYVSAIFDWLGLDAVTLHPYLGKEALAPFLARTDKICIILCRTSNPGAGELQDLRIDGEPLWYVVARKVAGEWNANNNCMLVVGATYPEEMKIIRGMVGDMIFLVPGIGEQGGDVQKTVEAGKTADGTGMIIHSARKIIFSDDPAREAESLKIDINQFR
ncbi:MAG: orotidine-5'-phosphate decarboxylase [Parcubacteria group bacterium]|nr:orotidine-5'-phosphate decarboxylase [Parcubacteria group bacterium]